MRSTHPRLTRRAFVTSGAAMPVARALQEASPGATPDDPAPAIAGTWLRVLLPSHPLSAYNEAIRTLAMDWSLQEQVTVRLDIVPHEDIAAAFEAGLESGEGHDLVVTHMPMLHRADALRDLTPLFDRAESLYGPAAAPSDAATELPDGRRPAFSIAYAPAPLIYRRSVWEAYGLPNGPTTWEQLRETGAQIWDNEGMNVGLGFAEEPGSERVAAMILAAYGGRMLDDGEVALDSAETVAAVRFAADLYRETTTPEVLGWTMGRPALLLAEGIVSIVSDEISSLRLSQARNGEIANDLFLAPPPTGPSGATPVSLPASFRAFHIPRHAAAPETAEAFILMLVEASEALAGSGQLGDRPAYGSLVPGLVQAGGWLDNDPYGSEPPDKLAMLKGSAAWTAAPSGDVETRAHADYLLARMMARAARGDETPEESARAAAEELRALA
jgi:ABC-type glycerol-3-phosphate transport system substrate-binding protein